MPPLARRRSIDSSSSSSSSSSESDSAHKKHKDKKSKKDKRKDKKDKHGSLVHQYPGASSHASTATTQAAPTAHPSLLPNNNMSFPEPAQSFPPQYTQQPPPPSGYRIPLTTDAPFPGPEITLPPPFYDADGTSPVFIGSALMEGSVHPCKIGPHLRPFAVVPYGGSEFGHHGRYDLLPFRHEQMEWVHTSHGRFPEGRRPVEGGYEEDGNKLYHAVAVINGVKVPGKTGEHLNGARVSFGGGEHEVRDNYEILC
ncbi:hypothetical protein D9613_007536 [Agrocybe pediades]|uniref:Uncharacterized protein n=1 Tax=Agrocybe pediades TaxID=84607 RepID=A0A8H4QMI3_9AGAR|nr:hypothetical protein D9613_007536 [Agrocybe pediades]